jgi:hypothetical protein
MIVGGKVFLTLRIPYYQIFLNQNFLTTSTPFLKYSYRIFKTKIYIEDQTFTF